MVRAILKNGVILPLDPLPPKWTEGWELSVQEVGPPRTGPVEIDEDFKQLEELCRQNDPQDDERLRTALEKAYQQAKATVRREMGIGVTA